MKAIKYVIGLLLLLALAGGIFVLVKHPDWLKGGAHDAAEKEPDTEVPVKTAKVERATLHRYVEGFGLVEPEPVMNGKPAASATLTAPTPGIIAAVLCEQGKVVEANAPLFQLDERIAKAAEEQAAAVLDAAKATLAKVKATPRPEQLDLAQLVVDRARSSVAFAEKALERQKALFEKEGTSQKAVEAADLELAAARNDLKVAEKQQAILKASPTPEELAEATAKVNESEKALLTAQIQRSLLKITSPIAGTVVKVGANVGEAVDSTRVLAQVVALNRLVASLNIPSIEATFVKPNQPAEISPDVTSTTRPSTKPIAPTNFAGEVRLVSPIVDQKTDSVSVAVALKPEGGFRPGQAVRIRIVVESHADILAVPSDAVVTNAEGESVIAIVKGDKATQIPVHVGLREAGLTEVESAELHPGDVIVTEGAYGLPKETKVHIQE